MSEIRLVKYEAARSALTAASKVDEVKNVRDKAAAMAAYAKQAKDTELIWLATELKVRAERRAGELLRESAKSGARANGNGRPKKESHDATLSDIGVSKTQSSRWQKLAAVPDAKFERAIAEAKETGEVTTAAMLKLNHNHRAQYTGETEWYTPTQYIETVRGFFGEIDLDPASSEAAQRTVKAKAFFTAEDSGLENPWYGRVWMNPPYAQPLIARFIGKLIAEYSEGNVSEAIALTHNSTDTAWFHSMAGVVDAICLTRGRIAFLDPKGARCAPTQGQAFFYFGDRVDEFKKLFSQFGFILRPA